MNPFGDEERGIMDDLSEATTLSWSTRLQCFIGCFVLGWVISIIGGIFVFTNLSLFAILYTLGNIISLGSTMFLVGPMKQIKNMFASTRLIATIAVFVTFILTFVAAFAKLPLLAILLVGVQFVAFTWYSISYIPFARDAVLGFCKTLC